MCDTIYSFIQGQIFIFKSWYIYMQITISFQIQYNILSLIASSPPYDIYKFIIHVRNSGFSNALATQNSSSRLHDSSECFRSDEQVLNCHLGDFSNIFRHFG